MRTERQKKETVKVGISYFQEMVMLAHKVDRLERWLLQIADKVNVKLKP